MPPPMFRAYVMELQRLHPGKFGFSCVLAEWLMADPTRVTLSPYGSGPSNDGKVFEYASTLAIVAWVATNCELERLFRFPPPGSHGLVIDPVGLDTIRMDVPDDVISCGTGGPAENRRTFWRKHAKTYKGFSTPSSPGTRWKALTYPGKFNQWARAFQPSPRFKAITAKLLAVGSTDPHVYCVIPTDAYNVGVDAIIAVPLEHGHRAVLYLQHKCWGNDVTSVADPVTGLDKRPEHIVEGARRGRECVMEPTITWSSAAPQTANRFFAAWAAAKQKAKMTGQGETYDFFVLVTANPMDGTVETGCIDEALEAARRLAEQRGDAAAQGRLRGAQHQDEGFIDVRHLQEIAPLLGHPLYASTRLHSAGQVDA